MKDHHTEKRRATLDNYPIKEKAPNQVFFWVLVAFGIAVASFWFGYQTAEWNWLNLFSEIMRG